MTMARMSPPSAYTPKPINTSGVEISPSLLSLTEKLAEHTQEIWAEERLAQGWRWGGKRDDAMKLHPCLVPYDELPESEKKFDRDTALGTLRAVLALGYRIEPSA